MRKDTDLGFAAPMIPGTVRGGSVGFTYSATVGI